METARAILFADIAGSTGLYESSGDTVAMAAVVECVASLKDTTTAYGGRVVKTIGDEVMAIFASAGQAIQAANAMQSRFADLAGVKAGIKLKIGLHYGPVIEADGDCFGDTVNLAARLTSLASPEQILTSHETFEALPNYLRATCRKLYSTSVKGRKGKVTIIEALWRQDQGETILSDNSAVAEAHYRAATIGFRGQTWRIDEAQPEVVIGRDQSCAVVVDVATASRRHASVILRKQKIVIEDHSSNGTFVRLQNGQELLLRREDLVIAGAVLVGLGASLTAEGQEPLTISIAG
ncbi:MAG: adenylate/guanylate cyclase domain-containing protein [Rhodocyclales bacterium]|nr:adenylate/guanylate cyclase domain-containing protein [Rhodocyclales bacterium]